MSIIIYGPNAVSNGTLLADKFQCRNIVIDLEGELYKWVQSVAGFEVFRAASVLVLTPAAPPVEAAHRPDFMAYVEAIALLGKPEAKKAAK